MAARGTLKALRAKFEALKPGDRMQYACESEPHSRGVMPYFRSLADEGKALLYQRRSPAAGCGWELGAQKLSPVAARFVAACGKGRFV